MSLPILFWRELNRFTEESFAAKSNVPFRRIDDSLKDKLIKDERLKDMSFGAKVPIFFFLATLKPHEGSVYTAVVRLFLRDRNVYDVPDPE